MPNTEYLTLAGVPVVLRPPAKQRLKAPLILLWHGFGPPDSEEMLAEALPLETVPAIKCMTLPGLKRNSKPLFCKH